VLSSIYKTTGKVIYDQYYPRRSKQFINCVDTVLSVHYGFTRAELDFIIINNDVKYRRGNELAGEGKTTNNVRRGVFEIDRLP